MDSPSIAAAARRLLRSADAALVELPPGGAPRHTTPFVSSHEGRPVLPAAAGLSAGASALTGLDQSFTIAVDEVSLSAVPEPGTALLAGLGLLGLGAFGRRRRV